MQIIVEWVLEHLSYWVIVVFMAIESSFIPFPSEVIVPPAAWLATVSGEMNITLVIVCATVGALIGAQLCPCTVARPPHRICLCQQPLGTYAAG